VLKSEVNEPANVVAPESKNIASNLNMNLRIVLNSRFGFVTLWIIAPLRSDLWTENWLDTNPTHGRAYAMDRQKAREDHGQSLSDSPGQLQAENSKTQKA
jgi:hypothetical protein